MKQFKARIGPFREHVHAMEIYFEADGIIEAAAFITDAMSFGAIGIFGEHVLQLIDITPKEPPENTTNPNKPHRFMPKKNGNPNYCSLCDKAEHSPSSLHPPHKFMPKKYGNPNYCSLCEKAEHSPSSLHS